MQNSISISELESLFSKLIRQIRQEGFSDLTFEKDKYWFILSDEWANVDKEPLPAVGSLKDDMELLKKTLANDEQLTNVEMEATANLLMAISNRLYD
jgi:hypothetical protein